MSVKLTPSDGHIMGAFSAASSGNLWILTSSHVAPSIWLRVLGHPVLAGVSGLAGLVLSVAVVFGVATEPVFWSALAAFLVLTALTSSLVRNTQVSGRYSRAEEEIVALRQQVANCEAKLAEAKAEATGAHEDWEGCEAGYARLRAVAIGGYQTQEDRDYFDEELQQALDRHGQLLQGLTRGQ